jgi:hypothetical protein
MRRSCANSGRHRGELALERAEAVSPCGVAVLGFKFQRSNPEHERINANVKDAKVQESESKTGESSNKHFHCAPWGIPRGLFIR